MSLLDYLRFRFARPRYRLTKYEQYLTSPKFLRSREWLTLRYKTLKRYGGRYMACGSSAKDGIVSRESPSKATGFPTSNRKYQR